ncbi:MAG: flagellar biosynthesis anti-sigma factor FlgM [Actinomycetota bacterium]|nr:flagellar biosynthesis anti-sigma factor FlgM [Actinomycetota bacterium]
MQLSDREIQNTIDFLRKNQIIGEEKLGALSDEEIEFANELVHRIMEMPDVRKERVEKLKKALDSSTYDVSAEDIAKKLVGRVFSDMLR